MNVAHFLMVPVFQCQLRTIILPSTKICLEVLLKGEFMLTFESPAIDYSFKAVLIAIGTHFIITLTTEILARNVLRQLITEYHCR